jgi:hypothetical protein
MTKYNTTQLYIDRAEERGIVHRDYLAHCLRWTHIVRNAKMGMRILDVGCGVNTPLLWTFYTNKLSPSLYVGCDYRSKFETDPQKFPFEVNLRNNFDVTKEQDWNILFAHYQKPFDIVACLEVLEHMEKDDGIKLLENLSLLGSEPTIYFSTPCYNGSKAANHIYEWRYDELETELTKYFAIHDRFGTFASQSDILPNATPDEREFFSKAKRYYDSNILSVLLAPLHPEHSRNCIWRLRAR